MAQFDLDPFYNLFLTRLKKANEESQILMLQTELTFLDTKNERVQELFRHSESKLKLTGEKNKSLRDQADENDGEKVESLGHANIPIKQKDKSTLEVQKIKLLNMENLLTENLEKGGSSSDLMVKKRILFNNDISGEESNDLADNNQILEKNRDEQNKLSEILAEKVSQVKRNAENFSLKLKSESSALDTLEADVDDNSMKIEKERQEMKKISSSSWMTTIMIWGGLLLGLLIFLWAFLYMRIVSPKNVVHTTTILQATSTSQARSSTTLTTLSQIEYEEYVVDDEL